MTYDMMGQYIVLKNTLLKDIVEFLAHHDQGAQAHLVPPKHLPLYQFLADFGIRTGKIHLKDSARARENSALNVGWRFSFRKWISIKRAQ